MLHVIHIILHFPCCTHSVIMENTKVSLPLVDGPVFLLSLFWTYHLLIPGLWHQYTRKHMLRWVCPGKFRASL